MLFRADGPKVSGACSMRTTTPSCILQPQTNPILHASKAKGGTSRRQVCCRRHLNRPKDRPSPEPTDVSTYNHWVGTITIYSQQNIYFLTAMLNSSFFRLKSVLPGRYYVVCYD
jgi:hypothetical protein